MLKFRISSLTLLTAALLCAQSNSASIQGTVTDAARNKPVPGAAVSAIRAGLPPFIRAVRTNLSGSFTISSLPAGAYKLCVQVPGTVYLATCAWNTAAPALTLAAGQASTGNVLRIASGSFLNVRIQDTAGLAAQKLASGYLPNITIGVTGPTGLFLPARLLFRDGTGASYQVAVPFDTSLRLTVSSAHLRLADTNGGVPQNAAMQPFVYSSTAATPPRFTYTVTGRQP
jgi:hypothetical protein